MANGMMEPAVALNTTPAWRHDAITRATRSGGGNASAVAPPQRSLTRAPTAAAAPIAAGRLSRQRSPGTSSRYFSTLSCSSAVWAASRASEPGRGEGSTSSSASTGAPASTAAATSAASARSASPQLASSAGRNPSNTTLRAGAASQPPSVSRSSSSRETGHTKRAIIHAWALGARGAVLGERLVHAHARGRKQRGVVDQPLEERPRGAVRARPSGLSA